ncbi:hypothetical protein GGF42_003931 [Coemansia sp. RSA 2424]|nr:hypothetical protein GGF42_003931 [Coemansia sp. RSA 2424]
MSSSSRDSDRNSDAGSSIVSASSNSNDSILSSDDSSGEDQADKPQTHRRVQSADAVVAAANPRMHTCSLPNINLGQYPELRARRAYADQYADTYSDASEEDEEDEGDGNVDDLNQSSFEAVVMGFERSTAKLPAVRVGAARLGEMMYAHHRQVLAERSAMADVDNTADDTCDEDTLDSVDCLPQRVATVRRTQRRHAEVGAEEENTHKPGEANCSSSSRSSSVTESRRSFPRHSRFDIQPIDIQAGEEFNGLLAPGAYADDKQRAKADGGKLQRLALALRGDRMEREAKLFRPVIFDPTRKRGPAETDAFIQDTTASSRSKFPFCCCAARLCVATGFVSVLVAAIAGFFIWPRIPSISISSLSALEPAQITYDEADSKFGLHMPLRINYEIHSGNFYPLSIARIHVAGFDGVTGNKIIDTTVSRIRVSPLRLQFYSEAATIHYLTSDMSDPALTDLFGKCAPRSATNVTRGIEGRPGALTIRFQIKVDVSNLGWLKQPIVTLNQNIECPE